MSTHNIWFDREIPKLSPNTNNICFCIYLQEIVLQRPCEEEKLGLTLCYGAVEDGITDIFIGEVSHII